ncbi:uncharacterized protein LOC125322389 [Corvus hawaiiensis]|uniref:uncharacterized protein LOC125322389 n=1 Tax=Corvus hawaiiensis TaxID=134902 RepID=UPI0020184130|nr:uncharacterized protein LOC125322389 [Corvus hawaiiensis]
MDALALPRRGGAAGSGRCRRDSGAPETRERGRQRRLKRARRQLPKRRGREASLALAQGAGAAAAGASHAAAHPLYTAGPPAPLTHTHAGHGAAALPAPLPSLPPRRSSSRPARLGPRGSPAPRAAPAAPRRHLPATATARPPPPAAPGHRRPALAFRGAKPRAAASAPPEDRRTAERRWEWEIRLPPREARVGLRYRTEMPAKGARSAQQLFCHRTSVSLAWVSICTFVSLLSSCSSPSRLQMSFAFLTWDCGTAWNGNSTRCVHRSQGSFWIHNSCAIPAECNRRSPGLVLHISGGQQNSKLVRDVLECHIQLDVLWGQYPVNMISSCHCIPTFW